MARSGSLAALEQRLADQRHEDDRLARERRQRAGEQERRRLQEHRESQQQAADGKTAAVQERMKALDEVLTSVLSLRPLSFDRLMAVPRTPEFDPGPLGDAVPAPDWDDYASVQPAGLGRFLPVAARHARQMTEARARFEAAQAEHGKQTSERRQALAAAKARYDRKVTEERARAVARNAYVTCRQSAFAAAMPRPCSGSSTACFGLRSTRMAFRANTRWRTGRSTGRSRWTSSFRRGAWCPRRACTVTSSRVTKSSRCRGLKRIIQCYERLVSSVALRTLHEIFSATPPDVVRAVAFTGWVSSVDRATGKPLRLELLSVSAERSSFDDLVLAAVDPAACLARLNCQVSPG